MKPNSWSLAANYGSQLLDSSGLLWCRTLGRRNGDTFLCSYPKSGRTWLRFMLSDYQSMIFETGIEVTTANFASFSPNLAPGLRMGMRGRLPNPRILRVIGTHLNYSNLFARARIIHLNRDPKDTLLSYYHHRLVRGEIDPGIERYIDSNAGVSMLVRYLKSWRSGLQRHQGAVLTLQYEDLLAAPLESLRTATKFLGLPVDDSILAVAARRGRASNLRAMEERFGNYDFSAEEIRLRPEVHHVRAAHAGTHREEMSRELITRIDRRLNEAGFK